ncbi:hypothetical protein D8M04_11645 [Oceanobacillus piezotolerans]|uniref:Branched-chain amino acid ABC transporter substrate-binding protein n=1 Tax=Oceanobacillus piezotolerans TaxID=2448030 RepID=A0A498DA32_9BACI|nr:hypothetical protein [Oceanobacillus piezotolerans]RLL45491.1 hypothetical protein D8M04_11645 [Oceanobacillus piezotolerans]
MQKIKDERLILRNLKNIRIAYVIQTLGIIAILGYDLVTKGIGGMTNNPLWFVFIVTTIVSALLSMNISVEHESEKSSPKKGLKISITVLVLICIAAGIIISLIDGFNMMNGFVLPGIFFICGFFPIYYIYHLRKKREENFEDK